MEKIIDHSPLLNLLWARQDAKGFISDQDIHDIAEHMDLSFIEVEGVCTFYHFFHRRPAGKFTVYLNNSILSDFSGYAAVRKALETATGAPWNGVDRKGLFGLFDTSCIGLSDQEPAALINFRPFVKLTPEKVQQVVSALRNGVPVDQLADHIENPVRYVPPDGKAVVFREMIPGRALQKLAQMTPEEVIAEIKSSNLRGMGGAFFPVGEKWELCRKQPKTPRYVVCNADEGEPGTFKDRVLMTKLPELLIEGMILGGYSIGANQGIIYLRAEYRYLLPRLEGALDRYRQMGWLGKDIPARKHFDFDIRIQLGAGAYVCGEETALLDSLMGKRGEPWPKVYFPVERGYLGLPTIVNNVESFATAARVIELGAEAFRRLGTPGSPGTRLLSVAGDCSYPGVYEIEWGMSVGELLDLTGAQDPLYLQISGPSGIGISAADRHRRFSFEDLRCGGSVMIFNHKRDLLKILVNFTEFFKGESCGVCTPCRAGNFILSRKLELLSRGLGRGADLEEIRQWGNLMTTASRCGLGKGASNALINAMDKFPVYFQKLVHSKGREKGFDLDSALGDYREAVGIK
ncbi:MAG: NAD-reducing hydrogenase HoxS subunit alpha [Haliscomenobacter sp.]|nr:NAD-reducing hydrogenase HoxS subunit alpha [Haliscomenobacter sp.]